jgi:chromosome segregation protein
MLKALELVGFKSFADKTRFEFPRGISAVVGPNGSGKSNVVDAIKWVLGEQSVKSLRGKEMADVIFNGSATRTALNTAEATLTFDNSERLLALDTTEVHITRRVYRSGEGEYLINRQPCRLRDIRELFSGTGVATEAYSVIEQGKVDVMLQSSPKERRAIFEEAAGISRFKAKKLESLRRLERVDQNLLRLSDIVSEVESRLRSVRQQASKARRYQEHVSRLQELRTQVGLADWRSLSDKLAALDGEIQQLIARRDAAATAAEAHEAQVLELETMLGEHDAATREVESRAAQNRERLATFEATIGHEMARSRDLEDELARHRSQLAALSLRAGDLRQQLQETFDALASAEAQHRALAEKLAANEKELAGHNARLEALRAESEKARAAYVEAMRATALLASEISSLESQVVAGRSAQERCRARLAELAESERALTVELEQLHAKQQEISTTVQERNDELAAANSRLADLRRQVVVRQNELNQLQQRHSGASERASVLEELESRFEGLSAGVKEVVVAAQQATSGPFKQVRGLVADLFRVNVETAPLIDIALGERAQHVVVGPASELLALLEQETYRFKGRVGFIRLDALPPIAEDAKADLEGQAGVLGRADRFVEASSEILPLLKRFLGRTWIVEKLAHALALKQQYPELAFVTLAGESLAADGTLSVGSRQASAGLISRRSELRALKQLIADLEGSINEATVARMQLEQQIAGEDQRLKALAAEHVQAVAQLGEHRVRVNAAQTRAQQLVEQRTAVEAEHATAGKQIDSATESLVRSRERLSEAESHVAACNERAQALASQMDALAEQKRACDQAVTLAKVELAKSEERLGNLRARKQQFERDQQERQRSITDSQSHLAQCRQRVRNSQAAVLRAESQIAELYLLKESLAAEMGALGRRRDEHWQRRTALVAEAQQARATARKLEEQQHTKELAANEIRHERTTLADRLREDYQIELAELDHTPTEDELHQREAVEQEIRELRQKITNIGNVNLEALNELNELEARFATLSAQFNDLSQAKQSLEQIINKINADSRRLFSETLETVKVHFQGLFRKLFGGGQADIVLEEDADILESGIEVIARPPGKEPRNISLLSGGEKTLTCVALLLSIFQYRPSPFCVLDEVDAALDEANIARFVSVLQEFLAWTQFIVITHSKKTMTCATTLYGVTMQESGISKRVSVRFEDVSENGEINARDDDDDAPSSSAADEQAA